MEWGGDGAEIRSGARNGRELDEGLNEEGPSALVQMTAPVNRFPDFVAEVVQALKRTLPTMGSKRIAAMLARAGLRVARSTVKRLAKRRVTPPSEPSRTPKKVTALRKVTARSTHHVWHLDITQMPIFGKYWVPWWPFSVPPRWPFCWHVVVVLDQFSRAPVARGVFKQQPTANDIIEMLEAGVTRAGRPPKHLISDQGVRFTSDAYRAWCVNRGVKPRWGALGQHGSIAVIERFFRSLKEEALRKFLVPLALSEMTAELDLYLGWYSQHRPHESLHGATPHEVVSGEVPACRHIGMEVRAKYPLPRKRNVPKRRRVRKRLEVHVSYVADRPHLPVIELHQV